MSPPRFVQGSAVQNPYTFYHWQYVDIFVYFSHHVVTVPPVGWTNAAHRHGVCVLGKSEDVAPTQADSLARLPGAPARAGLCFAAPEQSASPWGCPDG